MVRSEDSTSTDKQPPQHRCWIAVIPLVFVLAVGTCTFLFIGDWLVIEDALQPSDAIAVLSGRMPQRALEAARLCKLGYASKVWLTRSVADGVLQSMHIAYIGEDFYNTQVLMHEGVPSNAVRVLEPLFAAQPTKCRFRCSC
jgi:uncharacterized SAM-binding protein YcdF (DUF218 family)